MFLVPVGDDIPEFYTNHDLELLVTPVKVEVLAKLLKESKYNPVETQFLCQGFTHGFIIG